MKRYSRTFRQIGLLSLLLIAVAVGLEACETAAPVQEMSDARVAIAAARKAGAAELAAQDLKSAEDYLASAEQMLNERDYEQARDHARNAKRMAWDATKASDALSEQDR